MNGYSTPKFHTIRRAIRQQTVLTFTYGGRVRFVEPYNIGLGRGRLLLRGFERSAAQSDEGGWHVYDVSRLISLETTGEVCIRERAGFIADDPVMNRVLSSRRAFTGGLRFDVPALKRKQRLLSAGRAMCDVVRLEPQPLRLCAQAF